MLRLGLAQMEVEPGNPRKNTKAILSMISDMKREGVEIGIFTEMGVPGYLLGDFWEYDEFIQDAVQQMERIREATDGIAIIAGCVDADFTKNINGSWKYPGDDGRLRKFNAAWVMQNGIYAPRCGSVPAVDGIPLLREGRQPKTLQPKYREFDDDRHFMSLRQLSFETQIPLEQFLLPFKIQTREGELRVGVELCEDLWCQDYFYKSKVLNVTKTLVENGAELIVNISCSPSGWKKNDARHRRIKWIQQDIRESLGRDAPLFVYVNNVGSQNNGKSIFFFDGRSAIYDGSGDPILDAGPYDQKISVVDMNLKERRIIRASEIHHPNEAANGIHALVVHDGSEVEDRVKNLLYGCKMFQPSGKAPVLVGLSGGIDSMVVAALYAAALGPERVLGINMPTRFNTATTQSSAEKFAKALGIHYAVQPIEEQFNSLAALIKGFAEKIPGLQGEYTQLVDQNIQPKIRFVDILSNLAAYYKGWFTCNANKTEIFFGYETLDGGLRGAVAPIGDLYKFQIKEVAEYLNRHVFKREVIPRDTIHNLEPSAELSADQNPDKGKGDPMYYPYHDFLARKMMEYRIGPETILGYYLSGSLPKELGVDIETIEGAIEKRQRLVREQTGAGLTKASAFISDLEWAWNSFIGSYFKRVQAPPIFVVSKRGFGFDLRETIMDTYYTENYLKMKDALLRG